MNGFNRADALLRAAVAIATMTCVTQVLAAAPAYTIQGFVPDGVQAPSTFEDVNASGVVVGDLGGGVKSPKGVFANGLVSELPSSRRADTIRINAFGAVATSNVDPDGDYVTLYADGQRVRLAKLATLTDINAKRQVLGIAQGFHQPAIYENGSYRRLPTLQQQAAFPNDMNDEGAVVGLNFVEGGKYRPARWDAAGQVRYFGGVKKVGYGSADGINNHGQVVGCTDVLGCFLHEADTFKPLSKAGDIPMTAVRGISDDGIVLGVHDRDDVVSCQGRTYLLKDLLVGDEGSHWSAVYGWRIGPASHIVGSGVRDGVPLTFIATLAAPCTAD
jgi:hypothetical protein